MRNVCWSSFWLLVSLLWASPGKPGDLALHQSSEDAPPDPPAPRAVPDHAPAPLQRVPVHQGPVLPAQRVAPQLLHGACRPPPAQRGRLGGHGEGAAQIRHHHHCALCRPGMPSKSLLSFLCMHQTEQHCTVQCSTVQFSTVPYMKCSAMQNSTSHYSTECGPMSSEQHGALHVSSTWAARKT